MRHKKTISISLALVLILVILSGCSSTKPTDTQQSEAGASRSPESAAVSEPNSARLDPVTLKIMLPGEKPSDYDEVKAEIERRLADTLNVKIDITYVPWSDLSTKTQVTLAAGENYDLIYDAPWLHMNQMVSAGYYEPLDELIERFGPTLKSTRPQQMWDANKYDGKIMGVPLGIFMVQGHSYLIRKDLREQLSLPPITTYEELLEYAYAVKREFNDIVPIIPASSDDEKGYSWAAYRQNDVIGTIRPTHANSNSLMLYYKNNDGKVYNLFEEKEPMIWGWITDARKLYEDGIIHPDVMSIKDWQGEFHSGKSAITLTRSFKYDYWQPAKVQENAPGGTLENVVLMDFTPGKNVINFQMDNFISVPAVSKNKERAIQFLNWANEKDNYDLIEHGIEGKSWQAIGDNKYKDLVTDSHGLASFSMIWNPEHERYPDTDEEETIKKKDFIKDGNNFTPDILTGFSFNSEPVKNEISQFNAIQSKYYSILFNGVGDPDGYFEKFRKEGQDLLAAIQQELQKQIDDFLASKQ